MKQDILNNLDNPGKLEQLYRDNKSSFKKEFTELYPHITTSPAAPFWHQRLNRDSDGISWGKPNELLFVLIAAFLAGLIAKIPDFAGIDQEYFYQRNAAFVVFPMLSAYFAWKLSLKWQSLLFIASFFLISALYINLLPNNPSSDTLVLASLHLPLFLWSVFGYTFVSTNRNNYQLRLDFLRFNGDLVVMTTIILISGGLLTAITIGLFELIDLRIEDLYFQYIGIWGLSSAPLIAAFLVRTNPHLVSRVSPVIARVFTPLILVMLVVYLIAIIYTGKDPYNDREFLLIFNLLLIGVMAVIFFSIAELFENSDSKLGIILLLCISVVSILLNGIALSAIIFRISEWGFTPNRIAVLGGNILILTNLIIVTYRLIIAVNNRNEIMNVEKSIAMFLPIYSAWSIVVTFTFPLLFNFK